jgi:hypothetical protein
MQRSNCQESARICMEVGRRVAWGEQEWGATHGSGQARMPDERDRPVPAAVRADGRVRQWPPQQQMGGICRGAAIIGRAAVADSARGTGRIGRPEVSQAGTITSERRACGSSISDSKEPYNRQHN